MSFTEADLINKVKIGEKLSRREALLLLALGLGGLVLTTCAPQAAAAQPVSPKEKATDEASSKRPTKEPPVTATTTKEPVLPTQTTRPITETSEPTKVVETPRSQAVEAGYHAEYLAKNYEYVEAGEYTQGGKQYEAIYGIKPTGEKVLISLKMPIGESEPKFYPADEWQGKDGLKGAVVFRLNGFNRLVHPNEISADSIMEKLFASVALQHKIDPETLQDQILTDNGQISFMAPFQTLNDWVEKWAPVNADLINQPVIVWQIMGGMPSDFTSEWKNTWLRYSDSDDGPTIMSSPYGAMINADLAGQLMIMTKSQTMTGKPLIKDESVSNYTFIRDVTRISTGDTTVTLKYPGLYKGQNRNGPVDTNLYTSRSGSLAQKADPQYEVYAQPDK